MVSFTERISRVVETGVLLATNVKARQVFEHVVVNKNKPEIPFIFGLITGETEDINLITQTEEEKREIFKNDPNIVLDQLIINISKADHENNQEDNKSGKLFYYGFLGDQKAIIPTSVFGIVLKTLGWEWRYRKREIDAETLLDEGPSSIMVTTETVAQHIHKTAAAVREFYYRSKAAQKHLHPVFFLLLPYIHENSELVEGDTTLDQQDKRNGAAKVNYFLLEYANQVKDLIPGLSRLIKEHIPNRDKVIKWLAHTISLFDNYSLIDKTHPLALDIIVGRFFDTYQGNKTWLDDKKERRILVSEENERNRLLKIYQSRKPSYIESNDNTNIKQFAITIPAVERLDNKTAEYQANKIQTRFQVYIQKMIDLNIPLPLLVDILDLYRAQVKEFSDLGVNITHTFECKDEHSEVIIFNI